MAKARSYRINDALHLVRQPISSVAAVAAPARAVDHKILIDVSGSMSYDLPTIRGAVKEKLFTQMNENDTLTLIAFSGNGEVFTLFNEFPVKTLNDLDTAAKAVDRWLRPVGCTGFQQPIEEVTRLIKESKSQNPVSLLFLSDGADNCSSRSAVLKAIEDLSPRISAATIVSYGHYADIAFLTSMAEKFGGQLIVADDFQKFEPLFIAAVKRPIAGSKKVKEVIEGNNLICKMVFSVDKENTTLNTFEVDEDGNILATPGTTDVWYLSKMPVGEKLGDLEEHANKETQKDALAAVYAALSLFSVRMMPDVVLPLLKACGDVRFIKAFATLFGRQKYAAFQELAKDAAFHTSVRKLDGFDPNLVPREDAFTVMDMLTVIESDPENRLMLNSPVFKYDRIGRKTVDKNTRFTEDEEEAIFRLGQEILNVGKDVSKAKELREKLAEITNKPDPLVFEEDEESKNAGYAPLGLVYNENRPNISLRVRKTGTVNIDSRVRSEAISAYKEKGLDCLPKNVKTHIYRTYTIVKDGIVNVKELPVYLSEDSQKALRDAILEGRLPEKAVQYIGDTDMLSINLTALPLLNRHGAKPPSAVGLALLQWSLTVAQATVKVYKEVLKEERAKHGATRERDAVYTQAFGAGATEWLKEQGITAEGGFSPKRLVEPPTDVYMSKNLESTVKGFSTLPSVSKVREQMAAGKVPNGSSLMAEALSCLEAVRGTPIAPIGAEFLAWLEAETDSLVQKTRHFLQMIARVKAAILVGGVWFGDLAIDANSVEIQVPEGTRTVTFKLIEKEEKV